MHRNSEVPIAGGYMLGILCSAFLRTTRYGVVRANYLYSQPSPPTSADNGAIAKSGDTFGLLGGDVGAFEMAIIVVIAAIARLAHLVVLHMRRCTAINQCFQDSGKESREYEHTSNPLPSALSNWDDAPEPLPLPRPRKPVPANQATLQLMHLFTSPQRSKTRREELIAS